MIFSEFLDILIPIEVVDRVYPGGFAAYCIDHEELIGDGIWHDDHLLREGAMSGNDVKHIVQAWQQMGLTPFRREGGRPVEWLECCVSSRYGGPTMPCSWLSIDPETDGAYHNGFEPGPLVGPIRRG